MSEETIWGRNLAGEVAVYYCAVPDIIRAYKLVEAIKARNESIGKFCEAVTEFRKL